MLSLISIIILILKDKEFSDFLYYIVLVELLLTFAGVMTLIDKL